MKLPRKIFAATMIVALLVMLLPQVALADTSYCPTTGPNGETYIRIAKYKWDSGTNTYIWEKGYTGITFDNSTFNGLLDAFNGSWSSLGPIDAIAFVDGNPNPGDPNPGGLQANVAYDYNPAAYGDYFHLHDRTEGGSPLGDQHPVAWGFGGISHIDFCVETTAVTLDSFTANTTSGKVTLNWKTAFEKDNAGFNLYRYTVDSGQLVKVNSVLIGAKAEGVTGASYSFVDKPGVGTFYYYLEDVSTSSATNRHGPVQVTVKPLLRRPVYRPLGPAY